MELLATKFAEINIADNTEIYISKTKTKIDNVSERIQIHYQIA